MLCKNCSNPLNGSERFCPHCGQALPLPENVQKDLQEQAELNHTGKFQIADIPDDTHCSIFDSEVDDPPLSETTHNAKKGRRKMAGALMGVFAVILLAIALFTAMQYFDLLSPVASYLSVKQTTEGLVSTSFATLKGDEGLLMPQINYKPSLYTVTSPQSLSLRKGPNDGYALISLVPTGTSLQVIGGSINKEGWVYVYVPSLDFYGWLDAAYLSGADTLAQSSTKEDSSDKITEDETLSEEKSDSD